MKLYVIISIASSILISSGLMKRAFFSNFNENNGTNTNISFAENMTEDNMTTWPSSMEQLTDLSQSSGVAFIGYICIVAVLFGLIHFIGCSEFLIAPIINRIGILKRIALGGPAFNFDSILSSFKKILTLLTFGAYTGKAAPGVFEDEAFQNPIMEIKDQIDTKCEEIDQKMDQRIQGVTDLIQEIDSRLTTSIDRLIQSINEHKAESVNLIGKLNIPDLVHAMTSHSNIQNDFKQIHMHFLNQGQQILNSQIDIDKISLLLHEQTNDLGIVLSGIVILSKMLQFSNSEDLGECSQGAQGSSGDGRSPHDLQDEIKNLIDKRARNYRRLANEEKEAEGERITTSVEETNHLVDIIEKLHDQSQNSEYINRLLNGINTVFPRVATQVLHQAATEFNATDDTDEILDFTNHFKKTLDAIKRRALDE